jgi:hypothetical protein
MHKDVKLQNINYSYVPKSNMPPSLPKGHILLTPWLFWTIFVALDAPCGGLQNLFWALKAMEQCLEIYKSLSLSACDRLVYPNMLKPMWFKNIVLIFYLISFAQRWIIINYKI